MEPIRASRAEEFGDTLIKYFAQPSFYNNLFLNKAAVLVGGRGSGKTHVLRSLSLLDVAKSESQNRIRKYWFDSNFIGCYIKMDSNLVSSFKDRGLSDGEWKDVFAHYINLRLSQEVLKALTVIINYGWCNWDLEPCIKRVNEILCPAEKLQNCSEAMDRLRYNIDLLFRYVNNPNDVNRPHLIVNGLLLFELCNSLYNTPGFPRKSFFMLIDEYESLYPFEQIILNTLIKKNEPPVVFKIAMRPNGWATRATSSTNEILQEPADFDEINFENITNQDYESLIKEIYKLRLAEMGLADERFIDVEKFLPQMPPEQEATELFKKRKPKHIDRINEILYQKLPSSKVNEISSKLIDTESHLQTRLNLVLLERGIDPETITYNYCNKTPRYEEWYHNNYLGILFLMCREASTRKKYTGFKTFCLLSSKIIRNFVVLFNRTLEITGRDFDPHRPEPFSFKNQDKAAYETSMSQVFEIEALPVHGKEIALFTNSLGRLFEEVQKNPLQSESEQSHFCIKDGTFTNKKSLELFEFAIRWSILQEVDATKLKSPNDIRGKDYMLNRIYCPYYQITYRKKRKLELSAYDLEFLFIGTPCVRIVVMELC